MADAHPVESKVASLKCELESMIEQGMRQHEVAMQSQGDRLGHLEQEVTKLGTVVDTLGQGLLKIAGDVADQGRA